MEIFATSWAQSKKGAEKPLSFCFIHEDDGQAGRSCWSRYAARRKSMLPCFKRSARRHKIFSTKKKKGLKKPLFHSPN